VTSQEYLQQNVAGQAVDGTATVQRRHARIAPADHARALRNDKLRLLVFAHVKLYQGRLRD
jgi:hypothetical protein